MNSDGLVHILLIEDCDLDTVWIEDAGSEPTSEIVYHRVNSEEGLVRSLAEYAFDLILCDDHLQTFDSFRALEVIRQSSQCDLPFAIVSGSIGDEAAAAIMKAGASDFIAKGHLARLVPAINRAMQDASRRRPTSVADERLRESDEKLKEALDALTRTQNYLADLERYRALGQIATGVAHDFNNGLTKILGLTELLMERFPDEREAFDEIRAVTRESARAVQRLRHHSQKSPVSEAPPDPVDLRAVIEQTIELTEPKWKTAAEMAARYINIETNLADDSLVIGNAAELREVFISLIFNACDALTKGGTITISTRITGDFVVAAVKDTGIGMTDEVRRRCLEPFFTTRGESASGLGLGMVDNVLKRYGGSMQIDSVQGTGTTVTIQLNRHVAVADVSDLQQKPKSAGGAISPRHILVVDDEPMIARLLKAFLELDGHRVTVARNGQEALGLFVPGDHDIVITDCAMPSMNGEELSRALKERSPQLPVIMSSGLVDHLDGCPKGVDVLMPKPVSRISLQQALAALFTS